MRLARSASGFTLIELMVTLVIAAILAAIAVPAYNNYVTRSRISEAVARLAEGRMRMEQFFQDNRTYSGGTLPANTSRFTFLFPTAPDASSYTIRASGTGSMSDFAYEIDQDNARTTVSLPGDWSGEGTNCWVINSGGGC